MTKRRPPLTPQRALTRVAELIDWPEMARLSGKSVRTVMDWSDPDTSAGVSFDDALAFDHAFRAAGGDHYPFLQAFQHQLALRAADSFADQVEVHRRTVDSIRESGEAHAAAISAAGPDADPLSITAALAEIEQSIEAMKRLAIGVATLGRPMAASTAATEPAVEQPP